MSRTFRPRQRAELYVIDVETAESRLVHTSTKVPIEAPTWSRDGQWLVVSGNGQLFRVPVTGAGDLEQITLTDVPPLTHHHVLSPDGRSVYVSADDGHVYAAPAEGGKSRRVTNDRGPRFEHFVHGISPDGAVLSYVGVKTKKDGRVETDVFTIPSVGGDDLRMTDDPIVDDGAEFSPDGEWIYFNSARGSDKPGHAQLFRIALDRVRLEQLTSDKRVNRFPHPSPDGTRVAYLSYKKNTEGAVTNANVIIRVLEPETGKRDLVEVFGGQGTLNAPCWSPDGKQIAYVAYPISG